MRELTQRDLVRDALLTGRTISALEALNEWGCFRLAARISELRHDGMAIKSDSWKTPGGATISRYRLEAPAEHQPDLF